MPNRDRKPDPVQRAAQKQNEQMQKDQAAIKRKPPPQHGEAPPKPPRPSSKGPDPREESHRKQQMEAARKRQEARRNQHLQQQEKNIAEGNFETDVPDEGHIPTRDLGKAKQHHDSVTQQQQKVRDMPSGGTPGQAKPHATRRDPAAARQQDTKIKHQSQQYRKPTPSKPSQPQHSKPSGMKPHSHNTAPKATKPQQRHQPQQQQRKPNVQTPQVRKPHQPPPKANRNGNANAPPQEGGYVNYNKNAHQNRKAWSDDKIQQHEDVSQVRELSEFWSNFEQRNLRNENAKPLSNTAICHDIFSFSELKFVIWYCSRWRRGLQQGGLRQSLQQPGPHTRSWRKVQHGSSYVFYTRKSHNYFFKIHHQWSKSNFVIILFLIIHKVPTATTKGAVGWGAGKAKSGGKSATQRRTAGARGPRRRIFINNIVIFKLKIQIEFY